MRHPLRAIGLFCLPLLLAAAASGQDPLEIVRRANAAFDRQDYDAAVKLYTDAEAAIDNPGLVAFNKGAALYRLGDYRKAQEHYQRCFDEADESQRAAMLFNLGNCLLQQAQAGGDLSLFRQAIDSFSRCQRQEATDADLRASARHNLELAKLLWLQARLARQNQPDKDPGSDPNPEPPMPEKIKPEQKSEDGADPNPGTNPKPVMDKKGKVEKKHAEEKKAIETNETAAGRGNIPPPADDVKLKPLSVEDALKNIDAALERIRGERNVYRQRAAPAPSRDVPDY